MKIKKNSIIYILITIGILFLTLFLNAINIFNDVDNIFYDFSILKKNQIQKQITYPITVIGIDDRSFAPGKPAWPWSRQRYADLLNTIRPYHPQAVAFDMINSSDRDTTGDDAFSEAIEKSGNIILAQRRQYNRKTKKVDTISSIPKFAEKAFGSGLVNIDPDPDGIVRQYKPINEYLVKKKFKIGNLVKVAIQKQFSYSFNLYIISKITNIPIDKLIYRKDSDFYLYNRKLPINKHSKFYINYIPKEDIRFVSFEDATNPKFVEKNPQLFTNSIVYVGATTPILHDVFTTPVHNNYPGVMIHASVINTMLTNNYITKLHYLVYILLAILITCLNQIAFFNNRLKQMVYLVLFQSILIPFCAILMITMANIIIMPFTLLFMVWATFIASISTRYILEEKEKNRIKNIFGRYVASEVVNTILDSEENIELGGKLQEVTVLFSDIQGFTTMSEKLPAEKVVHILNTYFKEMVQAVFDNNGTMDKYIGDAIMATFGVPISHEDAPLQAAKTALEMLDRLKKINMMLDSEGLPNVSMRIGLNTGEVIVGNIGHPNRMEYTVIGDHVNIASRLEGLNKNYDTRVMISENTYDKIKDLIEARYLDDVAVKGKSKKIKVYELVGLKS